MPTQDTKQKLRTLYIQRATVAKQLDGILSEIGNILHQEPDYKQWLNNNGKLPQWIHEVTGGREVEFTIEEPEPPTIEVKSIIEMLRERKGV